MAMHSAVLHLRGDKPVPQPVVDSDDNVLCWNGKCSDGWRRNEEKKKLIQDSDTFYCPRREKLTEMTMEGAQRSDPVVDVLRSVQGPFAVTWLHEKTKRVYFAHDRFGRRSLLYRRGIVASLAGTEITSIEFSESDLTRFVLSNVAIGENNADLSKYQELPASGVYVLDLRARQLTMDGNPSYRMEFHPYIPLIPTQTTSTFEASDYVLDRFGAQLSCPTAASETEIAEVNAETLESSARALLVALNNAVGVRVRSIPSRSSADEMPPVARVAVLFSGGLDSVVLAALSHFHAPKNEPVDLLTVCFDENWERQWNLLKVNVSREELSSMQREVLTLMAPCDTHMDFNIGAAFWFLSRGRGELKSYTIYRKWTLEDLNAADLRKLETEVAALGLFDRLSTTLCPVDRCGRKRKNGCVLGVCKSCCFKIQRAVDKISPRGVDMHVNQREAQGCRAKYWRQSVKTNKTRRNGTIERRVLCCRVHRSKQDQVNQSSQPAATSTVHDKPTSSYEYQTSARVVLVGIGADEQLAGYGRHRTTLINGGEAALRAELQMDLGRIWKRNLGRTTASLRADLPRGVGDKRALRLVARSLGLRSCAGLAKRAIQFGSRIAKVSNNGSNRQTQGMNKFSSVE
ncbi:Nucleophile aminohydrolase [Phytophthora cactorum]|nr:Nucleophile aminohydrolase [Phytophthora cactorum]